MPRLRPALLALALLLGPAAVQAQDDRLFRDTWFWGIRGGVTTVETTLPTVTRTVAPTIGADWVITRTRAALYVSGDYTIFDAKGAFALQGATNASTAGNGFVDVSVTNMTKFGLGLLAFPRSFGIVRPYVGAGIAVNILGGATVDSNLVDPTRARQAADTINNRKTMAGPSLILGAQAQFGRLNVFGQVGADFVADNFLLGQQQAPVALFGVRYALTGARERLGMRTMPGNRRAAIVSRR